MPLRCIHRFAWLVLLASLAWLAPPTARAETSVCIEIQVLPTNITVPGTYCLYNDLVGAYTGGSLLDINADDVVLDCNGHTIRTTEPTNGTSAIYAPGSRRNVTIRNCVLDGFNTGILLVGSVEPGALGNRIQDNVIVHSRTTGIYTIGSGNVMERNRISQTLGDINGVNKAIFMYSPEALGVGNIVRDNVISDVRTQPPPEASGDNTYAIYFFNLHGTVVTGITISGLYARTGWTVVAIQGNQSSGT